MIISIVLGASLALSKFELFARLDYPDAKEQQICIDDFRERARAKPAPSQWSRPHLMAAMRTKKPAKPLLRAVFVFS